MANLEIRATGEGVRIAIRVKPRASKTRIVGVREGLLEVAIAAPPVDGAANQRLIEFLARVCGVPKKDVTILLGDTGRQKVIAIAGLTPAVLAERLAL